MHILSIPWEELFVPVMQGHGDSEGRAFVESLKKRNKPLFEQAKHFLERRDRDTDEVNKKRADLRRKCRVFFNKTLEAEVVRKLAETFSLVPEGLSCLAQMSDEEHAHVVNENIAQYGSWLCRPYNDDGYIRATRELAPAECPRTKYEALFDERPLFDGIRDDFLVLSGSDTQRVNVLRALKDIVQEHKLSNSCQRQAMNFTNALREAQSHRRDEFPDFNLAAWDAYVDAISGEFGQYYLSIEELLLVCRLQQTNIIVY
jgi:hypothetical protein